MGYRCPTLTVRVDLVDGCSIHEAAAEIFSFLDDAVMSCSLATVETVADVEPDTWDEDS